MPDKKSKKSSKSNSKLTVAKKASTSNTKKTCKLNKKCAKTCTKKVKESKAPENVVDTKPQTLLSKIASFLGL